MEELHKHFRIMKSLTESGKLEPEEWQALCFIAGWLCAGEEESDPELSRIWCRRTPE